MRIKTQTNVQLVKHMMEHSSQGALIQAFVIEAIRKYAELTIDAQPWDKETFISQDAWKACAEEALTAIDNR
tara:strand:+ start:113 stop:328 length:216 start_codon:yes stop_codon:yes gene_type:complete